MGAGSEAGSGREDPSAIREFTRFFTTNYHRLVAETVLRTRDLGQAEDIVQEALLEVYRRWHMVDYPERYVRTVARHVAARRAKETALLVPVDKVAEPSGVERDIADSVELRITLMEALHELPEQQQRATALHYLADKSVDQVAEDLGVAESTVRVHLMQARRRMHHQINTPRSDTVSRYRPDHELDR
ncbi:sigma-70 family RNA polymerase sigma factor [Streptomyces sp. ERV7]|uniref:sigma-70 family RNA polymerase sigma factor n=1 Tax=Streptomyces sp. ERV7 TaxID=1322334 RepID=UPI000AB355A0|nr:sigma-70 family RNA polymerase sigma factor [Streptomyces sp. ERV7]